ncbi:unnamed protein product [Blepharisma stoltei]|uniref:Uncharacterized protein n=1 Tax=Blepharisma stoltei TaxID=1481888 RepID=A0AAU9K194_9CILI|nr:unnamed protein product [Blepharisma stoltei]
MGTLEGDSGFFQMIENSIKYFDPEQHKDDQNKRVAPPENSKAEIERLKKEIIDLTKSIEDIIEDKRKIESDCAFLKNLFSRFEAVEKQYKEKTNLLEGRLNEKNQEIEQLREKVTKIRQDEQNEEIAIRRINSRQGADSFDASLNEIIVNSPLSLKRYKSMEKLQTSVKEKEINLEKALARISKLDQELYAKNMQIEEINNKMKMESREKKRLILQNKHLFDEQHRLGIKGDSETSQEKAKKALFRSRTVATRK